MTSVSSAVVGNAKLSATRYCQDVAKCEMGVGHHPKWDKVSAAIPDDAVALNNLFCCLFWPIPFPITRVYLRGICQKEPRPCKAPIISFIYSRRWET
jgi:hypothetical protein